MNVNKNFGICMVSTELFNMLSKTNDIFEVQGSDESVAVNKVILGSDVISNFKFVAGEMQPEANQSRPQARIMQRICEWIKEALH